jgi:hypothetical protein
MSSKAAAIVEEEGAMMAGIDERRTTKRDGCVEGEKTDAVAAAAADTTRECVTSRDGSDEVDEDYEEDEAEGEVAGGATKTMAIYWG